MLGKILQENKTLNTAKVSGKKMQIQVEDKEDCKVEVQYVADPEKVLEIRANVLDEVFQEVSKIAVPGYRKGKAPLNVVKTKYKKVIEQHTQKALVEKAKEDIIFETKMKTIFYPQVLHSSLNHAFFSCSMLFLKRPEFELKEYKGLKIPKPHAVKNAEELTEHMLQELRVKYGDVVPFTEFDFVEMNDKITMDVKCMLGDTQINQLTKEGEFYSVGNGFYKEFDDNILGMKAGETRTFDVLWDTETKDKATFTVTAHMGVKNVPAGLDDAFAQKLGLASLEALQTEVKGASQTKIQQFERQSIIDQISRQLKELHEMTIPSWLVSMDTEQMASQYGMKFSELPQESQQELESRAKDRLKMTLILESIRESEPELQLSVPEIMDIIRQKIVDQGEDPNKVLVEAQASGRLQNMVASMQHEATLDFLVKHSEIIA